MFYRNNNKNNTKPSFNLISLSRNACPKILYCKVTIDSLLLFWCPYMLIEVSVQYNGGLLPDIVILLTLAYATSLGNPFDTM